MAIFNYKKYQILVRPGSHKTQGLQTGDIVRRQYFDGKNVIYSLMCVLSYGVNKVHNPTAGKDDDQAYFIGALLEGDEPRQSELLDFARITNLFNVDRSGALYLTASDDEAPFMDIIDNIGRAKGLSWPENISSPGFEDASSQYIIAGHQNFEATYKPYLEGNHRILTVRRVMGKTEAFEGIKQDFYRFVENPNRVLISYKIRADQNMMVPMSLGYVDDLKKDAEWIEEVTTEWQYKFHVITVDYSGRHLRSFKASLESLQVGDVMQVADFNMILLSSVANFGDASTSRVGKLEGVVDPVFGQLEGYGAYMQKLYASRAAHISGTLTAGDENGFGATFYAGKIHRNSFINSLEPAFVSGIILDNLTVTNPTGVGNVYRSATEMVMKAQTHDWLVSHLGKRYCFSFWAYAKRPCQLGIVQNGQIVGNIQIMEDQTHEWRRVNACFDIVDSAAGDEPVIIKIAPVFQPTTFIQTGAGEEDIDDSVFYFTAAQLESGEAVTQYQPTDEVLNYTDDYGAWFAKGGIGGTIQNPLLKLNPDGSVSSRNNSFVINNDGTGYFANGRFKWDTENIKLQGITISWEDFDDGAKDEMTPKSIVIIGETIFVVDEDVIIPEFLELKVVETNFTANPEDYTWYYLLPNGEYAEFKRKSGKTIRIYPNEDYWNGKETLVVKCVVKLKQKEYTDSITIQKSRQGRDAYSVKIWSTNGNTFKNGVGTTTLIAHVYRGGTEITETLTPHDFDWIKTSSNPDTDRIFNASHIGWGNSLTVTSDDVWNMAQFDCKVRIN